MAERRERTAKEFMDERRAAQAIDLQHRFAFHAATTEEKKMEHTSIRQACLDLALHLNDKLPDGREKSLAFTHLEEVMFWGNAAVARNNG